MEPCIRGPTIYWPWLPHDSGEKLGQLQSSRNPTAGRNSSKVIAVYAWPHSAISCWPRLLLPLLPLPGWKCKFMLKLIARVAAAKCGSSHSSCSSCSWRRSSRSRSCTLISNKCQQSCRTAAQCQRVASVWQWALIARSTVYSQCTCMSVHECIHLMIHSDFRGFFIKQTAGIGDEKGTSVVAA